ncbi:MAG: hypothetical protein ABH854_02885 [Candidatus Diapherotrites archaeon]|nr:hypothetical protein [Candidatus Micrarchaeota archaeon]
MPPKVQFAELLKRVEATMAGRGIKIDYSYTKETKYFLGIKTSEMYLKGSAPYIDVMLHPRKGRKLLRTALKGAPEEVIKRYLDDLEKIIKKFKKDAGKNFENIKRNYFRK